MATLFVLLLIGIFGGWEIVRKLFVWIGGLGKKKQKSTCSAQKQGNEQQSENQHDLLDFDEFCDIMDENDND